MTKIVCIPSRIRISNRYFTYQCIEYFRMFCGFYGNLLHCMHQTSYSIHNKNEDPDLHSNHVKSKQRNTNVLKYKQFLSSGVFNFSDAS